MSKMVVYAQRGCDACAELVPILRKLTSESGIAMEVVDVDQCHTKECDKVRYTPKIMLGKKEIKSARDLKKVLGVKVKSKKSVRKKRN